MIATTSRLNVLLAASDRRPVDPPPVVELKVFDITYPEKRDITFSYNANFFLSASLEIDPPPSPQSRNAQSLPANQAPVLTGAPIAGMAYLDRPKQAGYFIFPDLSVRHEGKYRLRFDLFEEIKNLRDREPIPYNATEAERRDADASSFDWRLITMSSPFQVYSAKKFPGLAESTSLSRLVAEQGCRVRIRRDVRMRRRDNKARASIDNADDRTGSRRTLTPQAPVHEVIPRPRSVSQGSIGQLSSGGHRRPSDQNDQRAYLQSYTSMSNPPAQPPSQYYAPPPQYRQQQLAPQPQPGPSSQYRYAAPPPPAPAVATPRQQPPPPSQSYYQPEYYRPPPPSGNIYNQEPPRSQHDAEAKARDEYKRSTHPTQSYDDYNRRSSAAYGPPPTTSQYSGYSRNGSVAYPPTPQSYSNSIPPVRTPTTLAPLQMRMPPIEPKYDNQPPPAPIPQSATSASTCNSETYSSDRHFGPVDVNYGPAMTHGFGPNAVTGNNYNSTPSTYNASLHNNSYNASTPTNHYNQSSFSSNNGGSKRSWESAFPPPNQEYTTYENYNNQRQKLFHTIDSGVIQKEDYDAMAPYVDEVTNLAYKRADGHVMVRPLPKVQ